MPHADPEQRKAYYREWKKGGGKRLSNKFYDAAKHANERAAAYGVSGTLTTQDAREALDGKACVYCGSMDRIGIDHRIGLAAGGPNVPSNIVPACHSCNAKKFRGALPSSWSSKYEACVSCGLTEKPHAAKGLCVRCRNKVDNARRSAERAASRMRNGSAR